MKITRILLSASTLALLATATLAATPHRYSHEDQFRSSHINPKDQINGSGIYGRGYDSWRRHEDNDLGGHKGIQQYGNEDYGYRSSDETNPQRKSFDQPSITSQYVGTGGGGGSTPSHSSRSFTSGNDGSSQPGQSQKYGSEEGGGWSPWERRHHHEEWRRHHHDGSPSLLDGNGEYAPSNPIALPGGAGSSYAAAGYTSPIKSTVTKPNNLPASPKPSKAWDTTQGQQGGKSRGTLTLLEKDAHTIRQDDRTIDLQDRELEQDGKIIARLDHELGRRA